MKRAFSDKQRFQRGAVRYAASLPRSYLAGRANIGLPRKRKYQLRVRLTSAWLSWHVRCSAAYLTTAAWPSGPLANTDRFDYPK